MNKFFKPKRSKIIVMVVFAGICLAGIWFYSFFSLDLCGLGLPTLPNAGPTPTPISANTKDIVNDISGMVTEGNHYCAPSNPYNPDEYTASFTIASTIVTTGITIITVIASYVVSCVMFSLRNKKQK